MTASTRKGSPTASRRASRSSRRPSREGDLFGELTQQNVEIAEREEPGLRGSAFVDPLDLAADATADAAEGRVRREADAPLAAMRTRRRRRAFLEILYASPDGPVSWRGLSQEVLTTFRRRRAAARIRARFRNDGGRRPGAARSRPGRDSRRRPPRTTTTPPVEQLLVRIRVEGLVVVRVRVRGGVEQTPELARSRGRELAVLLHLAPELGYFPRVAALAFLSRPE